MCSGEGGRYNVGFRFLDAVFRARSRSFPGKGLWEVGFRVESSGFRVKGSGLRVPSSGFRGARGFHARSGKRHGDAGSGDVVQIQVLVCVEGKGGENIGFRFLDAVYSARSRFFRGRVSGR